jgi:hypothetical protein
MKDKKKIYIHDSTVIRILKNITKQGVVWETKIVYSVSVSSQRIDSVKPTSVEGTSFWLPRYVDRF